MSNVRTILGKLAGVKETKSGWSARCPAHEDGQASLSVAEGDAGRVLLKCHAGCDHKAIVQALGLAERDLFDEPPADAKRVTSTKAATPKAEKKAGKAYGSALEAQKAYERQFGKPATVHRYLDENGVHVGSVIRWQLSPTKKEIRPVSLHADGWRMEHMPEPRPILDRQVIVETAGTVYAVEGEKSADAAKGLGLLATTSSGGANAARLTDWSPMAGRDVVILPDADKAGRQYAADMAEILLGLDPPATVRIVDLGPDRDDGSDVADLVDPARCLGEPLREHIERLAAETEPLKPKAAAPLAARPTTAPTEGYRPFPVDALPEPIATFVREIAAAVDCDPASAGVPILPVLASAIGTTRRLALKAGNEVPAILWAAVIAPVGSAKSTPFKAAVAPARARDRALREENAERLRVHERDSEIHETDVAAWRKARAAGKTTEPPPPRPERPASRRAAVVDITVEALAAMLANNPRGLLLARDELSGWLGNLGRYANAAPGADESFFLSAYDGEEHSVDRRTGDRTEIGVETAAVSITGTIQPSVFRQHVTAQRRASGLLARLFVTSPPGRPSRWTEAEVSFATRQAYEDVVAALYELKADVDDDGKERPRIARIAPEAKRLYVAWHDEKADEIATTRGEDLAGAISKLRGMAGRLALVLHMAKAVVDQAVDPDVVDADSMRRAIVLAEWFKSEAVRTYRLFSESAEEYEERTGDEKLLGWLRRQAEPVTAREALTRCRWLATAEEAEAALSRLAAGGHGAWQSKPPGDRGGRPTRIFLLAEPADPPATATAQPAKIPPFPSFANADDPPTLSGGVVEV